MNLAHYPRHWRALSVAIRFERAQGRCEAHRIGQRCTAQHGHPHPITGSRVVLTVAHLCQCRDAEGRKCGDPDHLAALCQRCHLALDLPHHVAKRQARRHAQKAVADLFA